MDFQLKIPMTPSGVETANVCPLAQCIKQLRHRMLPLIYKTDISHINAIKHFSRNKHTNVLTYTVYSILLTNSITQREVHFCHKP
jgi:hypothetical protein